MPCPFGTNIKDMNKALTLGLMAVCVSAGAQVVRLEVDYIDNKGMVPGDTYRVYAVMENEGDILDAVFGEKSAPMRIESTASFNTPRAGLCRQTFNATTPPPTSLCSTILGSPLGRKTTT